MIPEFDDTGLLPPGLYDTSLVEIQTVSGWNQHRQQLFVGLSRLVSIWNRSGFLDEIYVDGSFVTNKPEPGDVDIILVPNPDAMFSQEFVTLIQSHSIDREYTRREFGCEAFVVGGTANLEGWLQFFGHDRLGRPRGLLRVELPL